MAQRNNERVVAVDYDQIQDDLRTALVANISGATHVFIEGTEQEIQNISHMPLINIRLQEAVIPTEYIGGGWHEQVYLLVDILTFDFTSFNEASTLRSALLVSVRDYLYANPRFSIAVLSAMVGPSISFGSPENESGHIALATMTLICDAYSE